MELKQYILEGWVQTDNLSVVEQVFGVDYNEALIWQVAKSVPRTISKSNLSRSGVRGGGVKPWRQKGLGRARAGSNTSPLWRTGGVTFAAAPRHIKYKVNKKMYRSAMKIMLSHLVKKESLNIVSEIKFDDHKTKTALKLLSNLMDKPLLILVKTLDDNVRLAVRNIPTVKCVLVDSLSFMDLAKAHNVLITADAVRYCEEWLS